MKLDFISPHIYPYEAFYEKRYDPSGYDRSEAYERWQGQIYYLSKNMPMAWMVGETGFSAQDDIICPSCMGNFNWITSPNPTLSSCLATDLIQENKPPYQFGCEAEQETYAINSQQYLWDCGASGYSWWSYCTPYTHAYNDPDPIMARENYFGLVYYDQQISHTQTYPDASKKPACNNAFANKPNVYHPYQHPRNPTQSEPDYYYDPWHHADYGLAP